MPTPMGLPYVGGIRSLRPWSMPHRYAETARPLALMIVAKYVTPELAYVVQMERLEAKVGGREDITPYALRATMILRPEEGTWKVVHRHADYYR